MQLNLHPCSSAAPRGSRMLHSAVPSRGFRVCYILVIIIITCGRLNFGDVVVPFGDVVVPSEEVEGAVRELAVNKSCGIDGIYAEHNIMLYSSHVLFRLLGLCVSSFLVHGFLPDEMMAVALVPIIKSKSDRIMSTDNYRPIAFG